MPTVSPRWKENFKVRSFDIDFKKNIRVSSLLGYFQEVASTHAEMLGAGYKFVTESGLVWVLYRISIHFQMFPKWEDEMCIETWPLGNEKLCYRRDFQVTVGGETYINAASHWLLIDLISKKPRIIKLDEALINLNRGKYALDSVTSNLPAVIGKHKGTIKVNYGDLDQNRHVNNARYAEWIFNQIDPSILEQNNPSHFSIEFKHELVAGDEVIIRQMESNGDNRTLLMEGTIADSEKACFRAKIVF